jgi:hypothetical protein
MEKKSFIEQLVDEPKELLDLDQYIPAVKAKAFLGAAKEFEEKGHHLVDRLVHEEKILNKFRGSRAKDHFSAAVLTILGDAGGDRRKKQLSERDEKTILMLVIDVIVGKKSAVQFQISRDCTSIVEIFSEKRFSLIPITDEEKRSSNS